MRGSLAFFASLIASSALADPPDVQVDVPANAKGMVVEVVERDVAPGETTGWHLHHGTEIGYVVSGAVNVQMAGSPIRHVVQGDWFQVDRDVAHRATNDGQGEAVLLITYLRDKKEPWTIKVPKPVVH
jgi:quercetin dioxygenase-like cupin family protein